MLRNIDELSKGFQDVVSRSKKECGKELEKIRLLAFVTYEFMDSLIKCLSLKKEYRMKTVSSLTFAFLLPEFVRISGHIIFFSFNGLYRNAFYNIRYAQESIVQALYIDYGHPKTSLETKTEILKEIENKEGYRANVLISRLRFLPKKYRTLLKEQYSELSQMVHPTHKQVISTLTDLKKPDKGAPAAIDCDEVSRIYDSMKRMYDFFFFLVIMYFPEVIEELQKNARFVEQIKVHNLSLLSKLLDVKLDRRS
jgi:hypothetical protein